MSKKINFVITDENGVVEYKGTAGNVQGAFTQYLNQKGHNDVTIGKTEDGHDVAFARGGRDVEAKPAQEIESPKGFFQSLLDRRKKKETESGMFLA